MRPLSGTYLLAALLLLAAAAPAAEVVELENGLTVILSPRPVGDAVQVTALVRAGRVHEPAGLGGAAHLVEHMMFRATADRPAGDLEQAIWAVGGRTRAFTRDDAVEYGIQLPASHLELAVHALSDMLRGARFLEAELAEERRVVLDEIAKRHADPGAFAYEELRGLALLPHPYGARLAGTPASVAAISREDLVAFHRACYRPSRTVLVLSGGFDPKAALERIRSRFGEWKGEGAEAPAPRSPRTERGPYQELVLHRAGASPTLFALLTLPGYLHSDYLPSRFLERLLGGWLTDVMREEKGVALAADSFYTSRRSRNQITLRLALPVPSAAGPAREALFELFTRLHETDYDAAGLADVRSYFRAAEQLLGEDLESLSRVFAQAWVNGYFEGEGVPELLGATDRYDRVEAADLLRVARSWFVPENTRIVFLLPAGAGAPPPPDPAAFKSPSPALLGPTPEPFRIADPEVEEPQSTGGGFPPDRDASRTRLGAGPLLIHHERPGLPLVSGSIVLPAGSRRDPEGREGLALLALRAAPASTRGREDEDLRWKLFARGNSYRLAVDRDAAWVTFTVPREAAGETLRTLVTALFEPAYESRAVDNVRGRLVREARSRRERASTRAPEAFRRLVLGPGLYGRDPGGSPETLAAIEIQHLRAFHITHYRPERAVVSLVGDLAPRHARRLAEEAFADLPPGEPVPEAAPPALGPPAPGRHRLVHASNRAFLLLGGRAPPRGGAASAETLLLQLALGWRVFTEFTSVRSTAYEAGARYEAHRSGGVFGVHVGTSPSRVAETETALTEILDRAYGDPLPEDLVEAARGAWLGATALSDVHSARVAQRLAYRAALGLAPDSFDRVRERIATLTPKDLHAAAKKTLAPERRVTVILAPE